MFNSVRPEQDGKVYMFKAIPDYSNEVIPQNRNCETLNKRLNLIEIVENPSGKLLLQWLVPGDTDSD